MEKHVPTATVSIFAERIRIAQHQIYATYLHYQQRVLNQIKVQRIFSFFSYRLPISINGSLNKTPSFIIKIKISGCESDEDCSGERICENLTGTTVCCQPFQGISYDIKSMALCLHLLFT